MALRARSAASSCIRSRASPTSNSTTRVCRTGCGRRTSSTSAVTGGEWQDSKEWQTFVNYLKSDRQPVRVPFMAPDLPAGFVPRDREFERTAASRARSGAQQPVAITTALAGAGGYGKTTLAIALCHDERVIEAFDDGVLWTSLGRAPHLVDELAKLYEALTGQRPAFVDVTQAAASLAAKLEHRELSARHRRRLGSRASRAVSRRRQTDARGSSRRGGSISSAAPRASASTR